jgi:hypothetical protein
MLQMSLQMEVRVIPNLTAETRVLRKFKTSPLRRGGPQRPAEKTSSNPAGFNASHRPSVVAEGEPCAAHVFSAGL